MSPTEFQERVRADLALINRDRSEADLAELLHTTPSKLRSFMADPHSAPAGFFDTLAEVCIIEHNAIAFANGPESFTVTAQSAHFLESSELYADGAARRTNAAWAAMRESVPKGMSEREVRRCVDAWLARNPCERRDPALSLDELAGRMGKPVDRVLRDFGFALDQPEERVAGR